MDLELVSASQEAQEAPQLLVLASKVETAVILQQRQAVGQPACLVLGLGQQASDTGPAERQDLLNHVHPISRPL